MTGRLIAATLSGWFFAVSVQASDEVPLIKLMGSLQHFTHKTGLAIDQQNLRLSNFYLHEIEETLEDLEKVKSFDGYPISELAGDILEPAIEQLEDQLKQKNWVNISNSYDHLLESCNRCHQSTDHGYIHIVRKKDNPYMQSFSTD